MIDVAEKVFIRIADLIVKQQLTIRQMLHKLTFGAEIDGDIYELITSENMIEAIKRLGIEELTELEITCLLKVLSKTELDGAILVMEFLQIMENFGLYDD